MHYKKKRSNPYKEANEAFLVEKSKEEGIVVLDSGVMYRKLEEGHGTKCPKPNGWEVYIPAKWGYGAMKMDDIPAHSTLIFEMQLVKIER